jgi:hypothetical protein
MSIPIESRRFLRGALAIASFLAVIPVRAVTADPVVFWHNDPVDPDDAVLMIGAQLDRVTKITVEPLADPGVARVVEIIQPASDSLKFILPANLSKDAYRVTLESSGARLQRTLNAPTVDWMQGDLGPAASPGGWLRIFGRNVARHKGAHVTLTPVGAGAGIVLVPQLGDMWSATFDLPADLAPGDYVAGLFNGDIGQPAEAGKGIEIAAPLAASPSHFDATNFGARGDGHTDDTAAIEAALVAAQAAGGGDVFLQAGRYFVTRGLVIPDGVLLRGETMDRTSLLWPDFQIPPPSLISGARRFALQDLTLYASMHAEIITGGFANQTALLDAADIRIARVRIRASAYRGHLDSAQTAARMEQLKRIFSMAPFAIRLTGRNLALVDCDVISSGGSLQLLRANGALVTGNSLGSGRLGSYFITGSQRVIFENNLIFSSDLQSTGGGINTLANDAPVSENIYVHANTFTSLLGWDREGMTTDGPGGYYYGNVARANGRALHLTSPQPGHFLLGTWTGALVFVAAGTGRGQWAQVTRLEGAPGREALTVTLDHSFAAPLDDTSIVSISQMQRNYLVIGNVFEDTGVAFQTYGSGIDHVIAENVSRRTSGFFLYGSYYHHFQPDWHIQVLGNRLSGGNVYRAGPNHGIFSGNSLFAIYGDQEKDEPDLPPLMSGVILRGNDVGEDGQIVVRGRSRQSPGVRDVVVEKNVASGRKGFVTMDGGSANILERQNPESNP